MPVDQAEMQFGSLGSPTDLNGNGGYIALRTSMPPEQMENVLRAERDGTVKKIHAAAGATLAVDALILEFA